MLRWVDGRPGRKYIGHFVFYGSLSLIFLSFVRLLHLGGVYEAIEKKN